MKTKPHYAGENPIPPLPGTRGYIRVVSRGCITTETYYGEVGCGHDYRWECETCPVHLDFMEKTHASN